MTTFAQSDHRRVAAAIAKGESFETYGNLSGTPVTAYNGRTDVRRGYIGDAALKQLIADAEAGAIEYVLYSYFTPIAWKTAEGWRYDEYRHGAASDKALSTVRAAIKGDILILRTRHHLSDAQLELLDGLSLYPGFPSGQGYRSADVLERRGYITREGKMGIRTITDLGRAVLTGTGIKAVWA